MVRGEPGRGCFLAILLPGRCIGYRICGFYHCTALSVKPHTLRIKQTESSEGTATASAPDNHFLPVGQPAARRRQLDGPRRDTAPIKVYNRALAPPRKHDGSFPPQDWHETAAATNGVNGSAEVSAVSQWLRPKGGAFCD